MAGAEHTDLVNMSARLREALAAREAKKEETKASRETEKAFKQQVRERREIDRLLDFLIGQVEASDKKARAREADVSKVVEKVVEGLLRRVEKNADKRPPRPPPAASPPARPAKLSSQASYPG